MPLRTLIPLLWFTAGAHASTVDVLIGSTAPAPEGGIYLSQLNEKTGAITPPKQLVAVAGAGFQALSPDGTRLLSTTTDPTEKARHKQGRVSLYQLGEDRALKLLDQVPTRSSGACHVSFDRSGRVALFASYGGGSVGSAKVGADGRMEGPVSFIEHQGSSVNPKRQRRPHAHSIYPGPDNRHAFAADLGTDRIEVYALDAETGKLEPSASWSTPPGAGPRHMKFGKDGSFLYVLNELGTSVTVFRRLPKGALEAIQTRSTLPDEARDDAMTCSEIRIHPNGEWLFTANRDTARQGRDSLSSFRIGPEGRLERRQVVPAGVSIPRNINLSPSGHWLITGGQKSDDLVVFAVDPDSGKLTQTGDPVPCPGPMCYVFLPLPPTK